MRVDMSVMLIIPDIEYTSMPPKLVIYKAPIPKYGRGIKPITTNNIYIYIRCIISLNKITITTINIQFCNIIGNSATLNIVIYCNIYN